MHSQNLKLLRKINSASLNILIVEDNDSSRRLIMELLRSAGFSNLTLARHAEEAIDYITDQSPDLLITDWGLPGMSGLDLVRTIRQAAVEPDARFTNPAVPVVMLTARQSARDVTAARNAGIDEFVIKPFSTTSLLKAICSCVLRKRPFIISPNFIGPDRRRNRQADSYTGPLKRAIDIDTISEIHSRQMFQETLSAEMMSLRAFMQARGGLNRRTLEHMVSKLMQAEQAAHNFRLKLIAQATQSLNEYVQLFGEDVDPEVLDVHLEALIQLNDAPHSRQDEANSIVEDLNTLVKKRKSSRKLSV